MLKTLSAALIAASILAAPAMAQGPGRTAATHGAVTTERHVQVSPGALNANARMLHRHHTHHRHMRPHVRFHKKHMHHFHRHGALKSTVVHNHG